MQANSSEAIVGVILGTAVGDSIGLPFEGLSPGRVAARLGGRPLGHSLLLGRGMVSDDTEHTCLVAWALARSDGDPQVFARALARGLRGWLLTLPPGVGLATLRGIVRLCVGMSPERSGVRSAGNGPAMRVALLGVWARDLQHLRELVRASTRITHTDPRAEQGAWLVARWARLAAARAESSALLGCAREVEDPALRRGVEQAHALALARAPLDVMAREMGFTDGVSGFVVHSVPAAYYCWLRDRGDPRAAIEAAVRLGGDTDTVAAIVGALAGAEHGEAGLPREWIDGIRDWPLSVARMRALGLALASAQPGPGWLGIGALARNMALLGVVVVHVLRRALPFW